MTTSIVRLVVEVLFAVTLAIQALGSAGRPKRRRALWLASAATALLALYEVLGLAGVPIGYTWPVLYGGVALLAVAGLLLLIATGSGETRGTRADFDAEMRAFRERRERERERKG